MHRTRPGGTQKLNEPNITETSTGFNLTRRIELARAVDEPGLAGS